MGILKPISRQTGRASSGRLVYRDTSLTEAAKLSGLVAAINPGSLVNQTIGTWAGTPYPCIAGRDLAQGLPLAASTPVSTRMASDAMLNGKPSISLSDPSGDIRIAGLGATPSFAWVIVAAIDPARLTGSNVGGMLNTYYGGATRAYLRWEASSLRLRAAADSSQAGTGALTPINSLPTDGLAHVYALTVDAAALRMRVFIDTETAVADVAVAAAQNTDPAANTMLGNTYASLSAGHVGAIGKVFCYDAAKTPAQLAPLLAALRSEYGISG